MIPRENLILAAQILRRQKVVQILQSNLIFTGHLRDRVRRSKVTMIVAQATGKNHDNVDFIHYVEETMRRLGCSVVRRYGAYHYRGVKLNEPEQEGSAA